MPPNSPTVLVLLFVAISVAAANDSPPENQNTEAVTNSMGPLTQSKDFRDTIVCAERKGTIFIDVHPEEKPDPNGIDKRIIHPGLVSGET